MKPNKIPLVWNIIISAVAVIGLAFCAIRFAMAIEDAAIGRAILFFFLASLCLETSVFSIANLLQKRK